MCQMQFLTVTVFVCRLHCLGDKGGVKTDSHVPGAVSDSDGVWVQVALFG